MIGHPAPLYRGVRRSNHDCGCDRRDGWVGLSSWPQRLQASLRLVEMFLSTRAKRHFSWSAGSRVLQNSLTPPTLLERRFITLRGTRITSSWESHVIGAIQKKTCRSYSTKAGSYRRSLVLFPHTSVTLTKAKAFLLAQFGLISGQFRELRKKDSVTQRRSF